MRSAALVLAVALSACASKDQVISTLEGYSGQSVDKLVVEFGPPSTVSNWLAARWLISGSWQLMSTLGSVVRGQSVIVGFAQ